ARVPSQAERERTLELLNAELSQRLSLQVSSSERVDVKAVVLLGFIVTATQLLLTRSDNWFWNYVALVPYAAAFVAGLAALRLRTFKTVPEPARVVEVYRAGVASSTPNLYEHMLAVLVGTRNDAFRDNWKVDRDKVRAWRVS